MKNYPALPDDYVPVNLDDAILFLSSRIDGESRTTMCKWDEDRWLAETHHGMGREFRNRWGLWTGGKLCDWFKARGIHHADDMSGIILRSFHRHAKGTQIQLDAQIEHYKSFWRAEDTSTQ